MNCACGNWLDKSKTGYCFMCEYILFEDYKTQEGSEKSFEGIIDTIDRVKEREGRGRIERELNRRIEQVIVLPRIHWGGVVLA